MTEDENKEFDLLQLADDMSYKNWMYFKFLYNKKFKESEERIKELEAALRFASGLISTMPPFDIDHPEEALEWVMQESAALGEKKDV